MAVSCQPYAPAACLHSRNIIFLLLIPSKAQGLERLEELGELKISFTHWFLNPRPSGLWRRASTNTLPLAPSCRRSQLISSYVLHLVPTGGDVQRKYNGYWDTLKNEVHIQWLVAARGVLQNHGAVVTLVKSEVRGCASVFLSCWSLCISHCIYAFCFATVF
jgi:hypothetical protein